MNAPYVLSTLRLAKLVVFVCAASSQVAHSWISLTRPQKERAFTITARYSSHWRRQQQQQAATLPLEQDDNDKDERPFDHRAPQPRTARRLNHGFKYLYRHNSPHHNLPTDPMEYLQTFGGFSQTQILAMNDTFPPLLSLSVERQLHPKLQFLQQTLGVPYPARLQPPLPAEYFGARLEKILAPRHAFLVQFGLPHGAALFETKTSSSSSSSNDTTTTLWTQFVRAARKPQGMARLCTEWKRQQQIQQQGSNPTISSTNAKTTVFTPQQIEAFDTLFGRGLMAMARNELVQPNNTWPLNHFDTEYHKDNDNNLHPNATRKPRLTAADLTRLLMQHGANPHALDHRGVSLMHWAAGAGNLPVLRILLGDNGNDDSRSSSTSSSRSQQHLANVLTERDHATLLHWAAAGAKARDFGCGGHVHVCEYLLAQWDHPAAPPAQPPPPSPHMACNVTRRDYVNAQTLDGNSALHWAAWSGTLETVKLLVRYRANVHHANRNGCTVAHWAASGGNVDVCRYLHSICGVDFREPNHGGNTPLTHAVAFGRASVVEWLRNEVLTDDLQNDPAALELAQDFVGWLPTDERRRQVMQLFQDVLDYGQESPLDNSETERDLKEDLAF